MNSQEKRVKIDIEKRIKAATSETKRKKKKERNLQYTFADKSNCYFTHEHFYREIDFSQRFEQ